MIDYVLKRSKRKSVSIEISREAKVIVRAPLKMPKKDIEDFIYSKNDWIALHLDAMRNQLSDLQEPFTEQEKSDIKRKAKQVITERVAYFSQIMDVSYERISIRLQKTRFGSCSTKKNLNFNALIVLMPQEVIDYVIVHELAHLIEMNHSDRFWREVERIIPDYKLRRKWLKENGIKFIQRI